MRGYLRALIGIARWDASSHLNDGKERYGRRHSQDNHICNPTPHARQLTIHAGEPVLRLHNF